MVVSKIAPTSPTPVPDEEILHKAPEANQEDLRELIEGNYWIIYRIETIERVIRILAFQFFNQRLERSS